MPNLKYSVLIPVYNSEKLLKKTLDSIIAQINFEEGEIIVVDDCSTDNSFNIAEGYMQVRAIKNQKNSGPAVTRNNAMKAANSELYVFIDSDCEAGKDWLINIMKEFKNESINVAMGKVKIPKSTFLGDSISALGFPGGGFVGFEKMWKVDKDGFTEHITSCNFAIRKRAVEKAGYFDETFPFPTGEDNEFAWRLTKNGYKIKYCPEAVVWHEPRKDIKSFSKWLFLRGRGSFYLKQKVGSIKGYYKLRTWSSLNVIKNSIKSLNIILVLPLLVYSIVCQQAGYYYEVFKNK